MTSATTVPALSPPLLAVSLDDESVDGDPGTSRGPPLDVDWLDVAELRVVVVVVCAIAAVGTSRSAATTMVAAFRMGGIVQVRVTQVALPTRP